MSPSVQASQRRQMRASGDTRPVRLQQDGEAWVCPACGERHEGLLTFFAQPAPDSWAEAPLWARIRAGRSKSFRSLKTADQRRYFVRGHLTIPRLEYPDDPFGWSIWAEIDETDFRLLVHTLEDPQRIEQAPVRGRLDADLPYDVPTRGLTVLLHQNPPGEANDMIVSDAEAHPLAMEQRSGITEPRVAEINHRLLHWATA